MSEGVATAGANASPSAGAGRRVLVVEDEATIAMLLELVLQDALCEVVGPAPSVRRALRLIEHEQIDAAVVDFRLRDGDSTPIVEALDGLGIPFLLMTGQSLDDLPPRLRVKEPLIKPFDPEALVRAVETILNRGTACGPPPRGPK